MDALGRVFERFRDPGSAERRELEAKLPEATGFAAATLREGLDLALAGWTARALRELVEDELGSKGKARIACGFPVTAVLLGWCAADADAACARRTARARLARPRAPFGARPADGTGVCAGAGQPRTRSWRPRSR